MCGIVAAAAHRNVTPVLLEGLRRLEYRGYDSAGIALITASEQLVSVRQSGKVQQLTKAIESKELQGMTGIAHTRWATHGKPVESNAHPQASGRNIMVVHNGIIENHETLRIELENQGFLFTSETDTEVIAHLIALYRKTSDSLLESVQKTVKRLEGAYSIAVLDQLSPGKIVAARVGSPLVLGVGIEEYFLASDQIALLPVTHRFQFMEEGDVAEISRNQAIIYNACGERIERPVIDSDIEHDAGEKGGFRHFMLKEIYEQPEAVSSTLEGRITEKSVNLEIFGHDSASVFSNIDIVQIVACGTSYHAAMVARYWFEDVGIPCRVEVASEFRYRKAFVPKNCLFVTLSQSGETADTLSAMRLAKKQGYARTLTICNVPGSSLVRESDLALLTRAGVEVGVASTKGFTTQLTALLILVTISGRLRGNITVEKETEIVRGLHALPGYIKSILTLNECIKKISSDFAHKQHSLFLGRGTMYPIAMEGALKLKEISYIHAEAYAAGELKHGPLALVDTEMPVIVVAPNNRLLEKLKANMEEVKARGGILYVFADCHSDIACSENVKVISVDEIPSILTPIVYTVPLQLLSYEVAVIKGTDIDQPRNLAKSVTVE